MRFFFDRCIPLRLARVIAAYEADHTVRHHDDDPRFHERTTDVEWLTALAGDEPTWVVVSGDQRILKNKIERAALAAANLNFFVLARSWDDLALHERAWKLLKVWPEIVAAVNLTRPKVFEVPIKSPKVTDLGPTRI